MYASTTKERILLSAIHLFAEKGYSEANMKEIAAQVGIRASSIYNHFSSKEEIIEDILAMYGQLLDRGTPDKNEIDRMVRDEAPETILRRMFFSFSDEIYFKILKIIFHEQFRMEAVQNFVIKRLYQDAEERLKYTIDKLIEAGKLAPTESGQIARIMTYISIASAMRYEHHEESVPEENDENMFEQLEFLIRQITKKKK